MTKMENDKQFVYILSNTVSSDILKIGKTNKHPEIRAEQLSKQTGTIGKYECVWFKEVINNALVEAFLHFIFKPFHFQKEQFKMNKDAAIEFAEKSVTEYNEILRKYLLSDSTDSDIENAIVGLQIALEYTNEEDEKGTISEAIEVLSFKKDIYERLKIQ